MTASAAENLPENLINYSTYFQHSFVSQQYKCSITFISLQILTNFVTDFRNNNIRKCMRERKKLWKTPFAEFFQFKAVNASPPSSF